MNRRTIILAVVLFILIVIGMFSFAYLNKTDVDPEQPAVVVEEEEDVPYPEIERITAKHYYIDGVHTFAGQVQLPTPCDLLEVDSVVMESMPEQIRLDFTVINNSETCSQVVTEQRFIVEANASEDAEASALFMGREVELNLVPAKEGETPEEFELFIKG